MKLRDWRLTQKLTTTAVAEQLGVSQATISRIERGIQTPDASTMRAIIEVSDGQVTPNDFFDLPRTSAAHTEESPPP